MQKLSLLLILLLFILGSCKKESSDPSISSDCPIKEINYSYSDIPDKEQLLLTYSGDKIIKYEGKSGSITYSVNTYTYESDKITIMSSRADREDQTYVYHLDDNGRIISAEETQSDNYFKMTGEFTYNSQGQLTKVFTKAGRDVFNYDLSYEDGNLISINDDTSNRKFTYNKLEKYQDALGYANPLMIYDNLLEDLGDFILVSGGYFGKSPKNLVSTYNGHPYTYDKDSNGILSGATIEYSPGFVMTMEFTRSCK